MTRASTDNLVKGLVGMMVVRNEAGRYLGECLGDMLAYCEQVVVLDDGSTDDTVEVAEGLATAAGCPERLHLFRRDESTFWRNESQLRQALWRHATQLNPSWIMCLDADELLEERWKSEAKGILVKAERDGVGLIRFNRFEFWGDRQHYRVDGYWNPNGRYDANLMRYTPKHQYHWNPNPLHCGKLPVNPPGTVLNSPIRQKHLGYADPADIRRKYEAYITADPTGRYCVLSHYQSIVGLAQVREWEE